MAPIRRHSGDENLFHPFKRVRLHIKPLSLEDQYKLKGIVRGPETCQSPPSIKQLTETLEGLVLKNSKLGAFNSESQRPFVDWTRHVSILSLDLKDVDLIEEGRLLKNVSKIYIRQVGELQEELELAVQKFKRDGPVEDDDDQKRKRATRKRKFAAPDLELVEPNEVVERVYVILENEPPLQLAIEPPTIEAPAEAENVTVEVPQNLSFHTGISEQLEIPAASASEIGRNENLSESSQVVLLRRSGRLRKSALDSLKQLKITLQNRTKRDKNRHLEVRRRAEARRLTLAQDFSSAPEVLSEFQNLFENVQDFGPETQGAVSSTDDEDEMVSIGPEGYPESPDFCQNMDANKPKSIQASKLFVKDILRLKIKSKSSGGAFMEVLRFVSERCRKAKLPYEAYKDIQGIESLKIRLRQLASKDNAAYSAVPRLVFVNKDVKRLIELDSANLNAIVSAHIESDKSVSDLPFEQANNEKGNFKEISSTFFHSLLKEEQKVLVAESVEASKRQVMGNSFFNDEFMDSGFSEEDNFSQSPGDNNYNNLTFRSQGYFSQSNDMELDDDDNSVFDGQNIGVPATKIFEQLEINAGEMGLHFMALLNHLSAKNISANIQELNSRNAKQFFLSNGSRREDFLSSGAEFSGISIPLESVSLYTTPKGRILVKK